MTIDRRAIITDGLRPLASYPTAGDIADAVWDEAKAGHVGAGTFGKSVNLPDVDGVTYDDFMTSILAVMFGVAVPSGTQVLFKERDGLTTKVTVTYGLVDGERTNSVIA